MPAIKVSNMKTVRLLLVAIAPLLLTALSAAGDARKMEGHAVTARDEKSKFVKFTCYRENVGGNIWMPGTVYAKDVLEYPRYDIPIKIEQNTRDKRR